MALKICRAGCECGLTIQRKEKHMDLNDLRIDPEFEEKIPPLTEDEFLLLEQNIVADGEVIKDLAAEGIEYLKEIRKGKLWKGENDENK
jgi:hypothetical protein